MIHLILKSAKEGINYSKFLYCSKLLLLWQLFLFIVAFTTQAEEESVLEMGLINNGLGTYGLDDEC
jgi:hypothetical protein